MRKIITFLLVLLALTTYANGRNDKDVELHQAGCAELGSKVEITKFID